MTGTTGVGGAGAGAGAAGAGAAGAGAAGVSGIGVRWPALPVAEGARALQSGRVLPRSRSSARPPVRPPARSPARPPEGQAVPGLPARAAALRLLHGVLAQGRPLDSLLGGLGELALADRGLAHAAALAVLRRLPDLDAAIDGATARPLPGDARARMALRLGLAQAWVLGTPGHAVIATTLALLAGGPRRLAHGVLSRLLGEGAALPDAPTLPAPWNDRWRAAWGEAAAMGIAAALAGEPPLDLTLRDAAETATWAERLGGVSLLPGHVRLPRAGEVTALPGFADGAWWVQDIAASLPARVLGARPGERIVDLCCAPGGKTMQLAAAGAAVTGVDIAARRLAALRANLARTRLSADLVVADALGWAPSDAPDAVLVDAPCSASGTARRHPDVLYLKAARDFGPVLELQAALLARAIGWLRPGGRAIYCVCSLERDEGEAQVERLLDAEPGVAIAPIDPALLPAGVDVAPQGWVRTLPGGIAGGMDGFFLAALVRR